MVFLWFSVGKPPFSYGKRLDLVASCTFENVTRGTRASNQLRDGEIPVETPKTDCARWGLRAHWWGFKHWYIRLSYDIFLPLVDMDGLENWGLPQIPKLACFEAPILLGSYLSRYCSEHFGWVTCGLDQKIFDSQPYRNRYKNGNPFLLILNPPPNTKHGR